MEVNWFLCQLLPSPFLLEKNMSGETETVFAASERVGISPSQGEGCGSSPTAAIQTFSPRELRIRPINAVTARTLCQKYHYLRTYPGGSILNLGIFAGEMLLGVAVLGAGPANAYRLFSGASREEVICLTRLWLDDRLGRNSESRVLGVMIRSLRKNLPTIKAILAYSDPAAGHTGVIYRAAGFVFIGESSATPLYLLPDGKAHHSRSLGQVFGSHSVRYLRGQGLAVEVIHQIPKLTYVYLLDRAWGARLTKPIRPYPKGETKYAS
jgi:hypothetical protein